MPPAIVSFDLIDTLFLRPVLNQHGVFQLVERDLDAPGWAGARIAAERAARSAKPSGEVNLDEIYAAAPLVAWHGDRDRFRAKELAWESAMQLDLSAVARVASARSQGARIIYITDSSLPREFFVTRLASIWEPQDTLLISHEVGDSKCGAGWTTVFHTYPRPWLHIGNTTPGNIPRPADFDIQTEIWTRSRPNRFEMALSRENPSDPLAAGLSRLSRLSRPTDTCTFWDDGANISGPVFYGFADWIMRDARARGIKRVFFLSRDGQLTEKIARLLRAADPTLPDTRYLYGSRHAWYLALFDPGNQRHHAWIANFPDLSVAGIFDTLELNPGDIESILTRYGHPRDTWHKPLNRRERRKLLGNLSEDATASACFARRRELRSKAALAYFQEAGTLDLEQVALVDIGWSGTMQMAFRQLLELAPNKPSQVIGYFFGLHANAGAERLAYYLRPGGGPGWLTLFPSVVEMITPADHGQTVDYAPASNGSVLPVLARDLVATIEEVGDLHEGALNYVAKALALTSPPPLFSKTLREFIVHPDADQAERWRRFRFWTWQKPRCTESPSLVPVFKPHDLAMRILSPWRRVDLWPWPTASLVASWPACPRRIQTFLVLKLQIDQLAWHAGHRLKIICRQSLRALFRKRTKPVNQ